MTEINGIFPENKMEPIVNPHENETPHESFAEKCEVASEITSPTKESRGIKRPLEEDCHNSNLQVLRDMFKPLNCELCNVQLNSSLVAYSHYKGKTHKKNMINYMKHHNFKEENILNNKIDFEPVTCDVCNVVLTSSIVYQQHMAGKQHKKKLRNNTTPVIPVSKTEVDPTGRFGIGQSFLRDNHQQLKDNKAQSSLNNLDNNAQSSLNNLSCEICSVVNCTKESMQKHLEGKKHAKNLKKRKCLEEWYNGRDVWLATEIETNNPEQDETKLSKGLSCATSV